ncbi:MAG: tetratricopeptide repeat protein [Bacteroides sp.]|nr:tetratricopeptide repeat protein [Bacteroides sp.]
MHYTKLLTPILATLLLLFLSPVIHSTTVNDTPISGTSDTPINEDSFYMKKVDEADKACAEGKWREAESALVEALREEPGNPSNVLLISNLGIIRYNMGQDSLAIATLNEANALAPSSVTILSNRARILAANGYDDMAYADYDRILKLDSMEISARLPHCLFALRRHAFATAKKDFEFMQRNFPGTIDTEIAGASVLSGTGEFEAAIPYYSRILQKRKDAEYYSGRAYCYLLTGSLQEASDDINAALELTPDDGELFLYRAALNKMRYRPADAEADARRAVELGVDKGRASKFLSKPFPDNK